MAKKSPSKTDAGKFPVAKKSNSSSATKMSTIGKVAGGDKKSTNSLSPKPKVTGGAAKVASKAVKSGGKVKLAATGNSSPKSSAQAAKKVSAKAVGKPAKKAQHAIKSASAERAAPKKASTGAKSASMGKKSVITKPGKSQATGGSAKAVSKNHAQPVKPVVGKSAVGKSGLTHASGMAKAGAAKPMSAKLTGAKTEVAKASKPVKPTPQSTASKATEKRIASALLEAPVEPVKATVEFKQSTLSADELARFRSVLLQKKRRLMGDVAMMSEEALGSEEGSVDNHAPIHPAEVGSHSFEQEFTLDLLSHDGDRIQLIEMAIEKLDEGTYGLCDECGQRIPKGRLEMLPESIYCVRCATKMEGSRY